MNPNTMDNRWFGLAQRVALDCLLFMAVLRCEAQNMVPNGYFEERDTCLESNTWYYPDTGPLGWFSAGGTGDYYMSCLPYGAFKGVPLNAWAFQHPQDGEAYVGLLTYDQPSSGREYFAIELLEPLEIGETYYTSMYVSASWNGYEPNQQAWLASSGMGLRFTIEADQWVFGDPFPPLGMPGNFAHVYEPAILADTVNWVLVSGSFVADSAYRYVVVGYHFDNANTDTLHFANYNQYARAHTLVDNVCVSLDPMGCPLANGIGEAGMARPVVFPNPAIGMLSVTGMEQGATVNIQDAAGRLVWTGPSVSGRWSLDVHD